ncbi:hypothetical protein D8S82_32355 [Mycobacterium hodleri]|uniref:Uncharacterized protein n=1 Tax=Mycolicibacterium hodleri TaxID=49897 RepID=A0A544VQX0_9MYCO|nr:hypothetical protein D8S82_32355 [Mycolicibacterium hodleri]
MTADDLHPFTHLRAAAWVPDDVEDRPWEEVIALTARHHPVVGRSRLFDFSGRAAWRSASAWSNRSSRKDRVLLRVS